MYIKPLPVCLKYIQFLFANYTLINLEKILKATDYFTISYIIFYYRGKSEIDLTILLLLDI